MHGTLHLMLYCKLLTIYYLVSYLKVSIYLLKNTM